ncbi:MAG: phosphatase PAP2 family protein [Parabacteroides sp.]|nr:phosphatase PAP2 family protein [Parabacteroides sp.]
MLEQWLVWEREAFFWLNGSDYPFLDHFMWLYSGKVVWLPLALFILYVLCYKRDWRQSLLLLLMIALTITLCDQFASHVCKPLCMRYRPTHHPDFMAQVKVVFGYRGGLYGFISSHAANAFGFAMLLTLILKNKALGFSLFFWATLTAYSRIYLGVHFITDIIPGALSGLCLGTSVYVLYGRLRKRFRMEEEPRQQTLWRAYTIASATGVTILLLLLFTEPLTSLLK